jgi:hypothetical protein
MFFSRYDRKSRRSNAGSRPPELAGRDAKLRQIEILIGRLKRGPSEQSMIVRAAAATA